MESIPNNAALQRCLPGIEQAAKEAALTFILPWRLEQLREEGFRGIQKFVDTGRYVPMLAPFEQQAWSWIKREAATAGERMRASAGAGEVPEVSDEQIRKALTTFSTDEWRTLIQRFNRRDVDSLRTYLDANKESLIKWLGKSKFYALFSEEIHRSMVLFFSQPLNMTVTTDALWAAHIYEEARRNNVAGTSRPSVKRSWAEVGGLNNIAASLSSHGHKVSPYKVKMMLRRMEQTPPEMFDGEPDDYLLWASDPKAYKRHLHLRTAYARPQRDPDPFFYTSN